MNKNTRRNIKIRGDEDLSGKNESDSQRESLVEVSPGYLLDNGNKGDIIEMRIQSINWCFNINNN